MCVRLCARTANKSVYVFVWAHLEHQFFWAFSQTSLSLHEWRYLFWSQPLAKSVCVCERETIFVWDKVREQGRERGREWVMWDGRERRQRKRCCGSSSVSSLLSGPWATQLPQSATAPPSLEHRIRYAQRRQICFNSPLTPRAPQLSKSGLNKLRGARQTKNTNAQRRLLWIRRSLCLPGEAEKPTRLSSLHDIGEEKWRHKNLRGKDDSMYEYAFIHEEQKCGCWSRLLRTMTSLFHRLLPYPCNHSAPETTRITPF